VDATMSGSGAHGATLTVCLSFDCDAMCVWPTAFGMTNQSMVSRGEFEVIGLPRVLDLLAKHGIRATFFVPGFTALAYPELARRIHAEGHEIGHHGWMHENPSSLGHDEALERGLDVLMRVTGARARGYRLPGSELPPRFAEVLLEHGFLYDSSLYGSDFQPYYVRRGDEWDLSTPYAFGEVSDLVELPAAWHLDDFPLFELVPGWSMNMYPPSAVRQIWQADFDYACANAPGGAFTLCMHPQVIGRGGRLSMLDEFIVYMRDVGGVTFERMCDYAERWSTANPRAEWADAHPIETGAAAMASSRSAGEEKG
jgi:peptidoglycan/xylan/chitin deacetylase (PgdA/CDA1 family)